MSDMANYNAAATTQGAAAMANTALQGTNNILQSSFNTKKTKELAKYQNEMNIENWNRQNEYNEKMALNYNSQIMRSARNAGLNPVAAMAGPHFAQTVGNIPSAGMDTSAGNMAPMDLSYYHAMFKDAAETIKSRAEAKKAEAEAGKIESETTGQDLTNQYMSETLQSRVKLTNAENDLKNEVIGLINSDQSLKDAFAEEKRAQVDLMEAQTDAASSQASLNDALTEYNNAMTSLTNEKAKTEAVDRFLKRTQGLLNLTQIQVLKDENFRKNHDNVGYLLTTMKTVAQSDKLTPEQKSSMLDVLFACYTNCSEEAKDLRHAATQGELVKMQGEQQRGNISAMGEQQRANIKTQTYCNVVQAYVTIPQRAIDSWINYRIWHEEPENKPLIFTPNNNGQELYDKFNRQIEQNIIDGILDPYRYSGRGW